MSPARTQRLASVLAIATATVALALFTVGCGDDDSDSAATVAVTGQWARTSPMNAANGAGYFTLTSPVDDQLVGVEVDASVAGMAEMHETVMATDSTMDMGTATTMVGMGEMTMQPVDTIDLPAGTAVSLKPGGYHIMLMNLAKPLEKGSSITLTLLLKTAGKLVIDLPVLDEAP
ncbi:MAG: hypothetical protein RI900_1026 [Actinomycetota bacterium]